MKKVKILKNIFSAESRPTTNEDNFGEIIDRWDLYTEESTPEKLTKVGHLVGYVDDSYAVFHPIATGNVRYDLSNHMVQFIN